MLLAIDAGNTNVVFAVLDGRAIRTRWRIATDPRRTADEYAVWLHQLLALEGLGRGDIDAVIIATVVPRALHNLEVLASKYFGVQALIAGRPPVDYGITIDIAEPESVGTDRVVNVWDLSGGIAMGKTVGDFYNYEKKPANMKVALGVRPRDFIELFLRRMEQLAYSFGI